MKTLEFVIWHTQQRLPSKRGTQFARDPNNPKKSILVTTEESYFTGSMATDQQLLLAIKLGIDTALEQVPYHSALMPYAQDILSPEGTGAFMSEAGQMILSTVYRSCLFENYKQLQGQPGISSPYLTMVSDHACDLTYSGLCSLFYQHGAMGSVDPNVYAEYKARAMLFGEQQYLVSERFDHSGRLLPVQVEINHSVDLKNQLLANMHTLTSIMQGSMQGATVTEIPQVNIMDYDLDQIEKMEQNSDPLVKERREAYYRDKEKELAQAANAKLIQERIAQKLKVNDDGPVFSQVLPSACNTNTQQPDVDGSEHMPELMYDPTPKTYSNIDDGSTDMSQPYGHQPNPYVLTGNVTLEGGNYNVPPGVMLLVDANARPVRKENGNFISLPIGNVDCRFVQQVLGAHGQPTFDTEGFPYIQVVAPNQPPQPFPLSNTQRVLLGAAPIPNMYQMPNQQQQPPQHNPMYPSHQPTHPAGDPWAHVKQAANQHTANVNGPIKAWQQPQTPVTPQATPEPTKETAPVWNHWNANKAVIEDEPKTIHVKPAPKDPVASPLNMGKESFTLVFDDVSVTAADIDTIGFRATGSASFSDKYNFDPRKFFIAVAVVNGRVEEFLISKEHFMDRKAHDPHYLSPTHGEQRARFIEAVEVDAPGIPKSKVIVKDKVIEEDQPATVTAIVSDIARDDDHAVMVDLIQRDIIPGKPVSKEIYLNILDRMEEVTNVSKQYLTVVALITELQHDYPQLARWLNVRLANWWTNALRYRLSKVESITLSPCFEDTATTQSLFDYLNEEKLTPEAFQLFNAEYDQLFKLDLLYMGENDMFRGIIESEEILNANVHSEEDLEAARENGDILDEDVYQDARAFFGTVKEFSLIHTFDGQVVVCKDVRRDPGIGLISPLTDPALYGAINGAFDLLPLTTTLLRVVTGMGSLVTVGITRRETGNVLTVLDKQI